jgi:hypothetical protein
MDTYLAERLFMDSFGIERNYGFSCQEEIAWTQEHGKITWLYSRNSLKRRSYEYY